MSLRLNKIEKRLDSLEKSATEKEKVWKSIKSKLNSMCRPSKHVNKLTRSL